MISIDFFACSSSPVDAPGEGVVVGGVGVVGNVALSRSAHAPANDLEGLGLVILVDPAVTRPGKCLPGAGPGFQALFDVFPDALEIVGGMQQTGVNEGLWPGIDAGLSVKWRLPRPQ